MNTAADYGIEIGKTYESRKGSKAQPREVIWISADGLKVQYDGPAVKLGSQYPAVSAEAFAKFAGLQLVQGGGQ